MSAEPPTVSLLDTHMTAALIGVAVGEILSFLAFDVRLIKAMVRKRRVRPMPLAYLISRYTMAIGLTTLACLTLPANKARTNKDRDRALHWLRTLLLPLYLTSTSAVLGCRALVLHFDRPRLISTLIHTLLALQLVVGATASSLARSGSDAGSGSVAVGVAPQAWICAPLVNAMMIDAVFTLLVVVPILHRDGRPRKGQVVHMLLCDAIIFGLFSIGAKAVAIAVSVRFPAKGTIAFRAEAVASTVFACRLFRAQESFLKSHMERTAQPSLKTIEIEEGGMDRREKGAGENGHKPMDSKRCGAKVTLSDCHNEPERPQTTDPSGSKQEQDDPCAEREKAKVAYDQMVRARLRAAFLAV